ncbi:glycosyl hydrolase 115 family protein [Sphingomonas sp. 4RDLI-65]|uniref:glycosyl hydrolase 115 family protein n=1 Tax=Sphingomonas sp. 4RDLI-65 TaxID=3111641 RepID=UPI003C1AE6F6
MTSTTPALLGIGAMLVMGAAPAAACERPVSVCGKPTSSALRLIADGHAVAVVVEPNADPAVRDAATAFAGDLARVGGTAPGPAITTLPSRGEAVIVGVFGQSQLIDSLVKAGRIPTDDVAGRWEAFRQIVVDKPFPGVSRALVIVGSDRRGAVFGTYDLSEKIGMSPWSWWADVPVRRQANLWLTAGQRADAPRVKYRGIFINDEEPAFGTWARRKFGGINARMYTHVFDLILRLKGNYLWPAMWGKAIGADDPASMPLADAKGIILGTSHHEPMTRAQSEWHRDGQGGDGQGGRAGGKWDYTSNANTLREFWRGGIERMMKAGHRGQPMEQLVTVGMRGDGDEPMSEGTATKLLEGIVDDQRRIIADVTGRPANMTPQVWTLYKEVQDYHSKGMKVPDDVTLLFADDNWGAMRRLPTGDLDRPGGYGAYYHFDYVGGPRSYKWLNTNQIEKTWQQMDLSYRRGARQLWVVNVGDIKPMEFPIDFFLKMAWNPEAMTPAALTAFPRDWASKTFGTADAPAIGDLVSDYSRLAARRKPELVDADVFALGAMTATTLDGGEFGAMVDAWTALLQRMTAVRARIAPDQRAAFLQLVEHPIAAATNFYQLYYAVAWNRRLAAANDPHANVFATRAEAAFAHDKALSAAYHAVSGGKWDGMMLQTHIGYTAWNDPKADMMPAVKRVAGPAGTAPPIALHSTPPTEGPRIAVAEAPRFTRATVARGLQWSAIPRLGRTEGAIVALPQGRPATTPTDDVRVDYDMTLAEAGDATLRLYMIPTLDTRGGNGMKIGVSIDARPVQILTMDLKVDGKAWSQAVRDNAVALEAKFPGLPAGRHTVKLWRIDDNMPVQKLVLYTGDLPRSYLGPVAAQQGAQR